MSEREDFEAWVLSQGLRLSRVVSDERYESLQTEYAFQGWQAGRRAGAVEALEMAAREVNLETGMRHMAEKIRALEIGK